MQQVYQKDTAETSQALATFFEAHPEAMTPLLNVVVEERSRWMPSYIAIPQGGGIEPRHGDAAPGKCPPKEPPAGRRRKGRRMRILAHDTELAVMSGFSTMEDEYPDHRW